MRSGYRADPGIPDAVALSHVRKSYRDFAISDLSLSVKTGTICGLVGENGAGKSTTIRLLLGAVRRDAGEIHLLGTPVDAPEFRRAKDQVGVVLDEAYFPETLTAQQMGAILADTYSRWDRAQYREFLERFRLPEKKIIKEFSRGMRMKLGIAAAMSHHAKLLILDEATAGLDPIVRDEVLDLFNEFTREEDHTILISSHIVSDLEKLCDTIAFLHQGELLFHEAKDDLRDQYGIFTGTAEQFESFRPEAVAGREASEYGGIRALIRRDLAPDGLDLERPSVEDVILFTVRGAKEGRVHGRENREGDPDEKESADGKRNADRRGHTDGRGGNGSMDGKGVESP